MDPDLKENLILLNDKRIYFLWLNKIIENIKSLDYKKSNYEICVLKYIKKEYWINTVPNELKVSLVEAILNGGNREVYYSHDCHDIMCSLDSDYPELIKLFIDNIFGNLDNNNFKMYISNKYAWIVSKYIVAYEEMTEVIIEKLKLLQNDNVDIQSITEKLIERIQKLPNDKKNLLLSKLMN